MKMRSLALLVSAALFLGAAPAAWARPPSMGHDFLPAARPDREPADPRQAMRQATPLLSDMQVRSMLRAQLPGELVGFMGLDASGPRPTYTVRWRFPDERVATLRVDARSGHVLGY